MSSERVSVASPGSARAVVRRSFVPTRLRGLFAGLAKMLDPRGRWEVAQRCEAFFAPRKAHYQEAEKERARLGWENSLPARQSLVRETVGVGPSELRGMCVLEIGGTLFADYYLGGSETVRRLVLDPLPYPTLDDECTFISGVGEHIPLRSASVQICWTTNTIDHCRDPLSALEEIRRVLTSTGCLYITCNVFASWTRPLFPVFNYLDGPHPHHYTRSSFLGLLHEAGFTCEVEFEPWVPPIRGWAHVLSTVKVLLGRIAGLRQVRLRMYDGLHERTQEWSSSHSAGDNRAQPLGGLSL